MIGFEAETANPFRKRNQWKDCELQQKKVTKRKLENRREQLNKNSKNSSNLKSEL